MGLLCRFGSHNYDYKNYNFEEYAPVHLVEPGIICYEVTLQCKRCGKETQSFSDRMTVGEKEALKIQARNNTLKRNNGGKQIRNICISA